ncbi:MAG: hypothetical protein IPM24_11855 [Bryobacterales bacterium]|nr:hypothetical protein [Bryobacterales bacterium]
MRRRDFLAAALACPAAAQTLPNGIRLPDVWPPRDAHMGSEPPPLPPYLAKPPAVIPIDGGRQLFVDDFLIAENGLRRTFHQPVPYEGNPVLKADRPWEFDEVAGQAMPFSDGVWFDPADGLFKMWYRSQPGTCYATSANGVDWEKPSLDVRPGTNVVHEGHRDSSAVWLDQFETDPKKRYKFLYSSGHMRPLHLHHSPDGIHWGEPAAKSVPWSDRTTFFYNPFRRVWVLSLRDHDWGPRQPDKPGYLGRMRRYREHADLTAAMEWRDSEAVPWVTADRLDAQRIDINARPQLYNLDAVAYESVMLGLFTIWRGQYFDSEKPNDVTVGFSRDGFHWHRPDRRPFLPVSRRFGDWNFANVQSAGGCCLVVGDRLYFYMSGRGGAKSVRRSGEMSTGLATLRRDGFVSMEAGAAGGTLTTRPVRFSGRHLFLNTDSLAGDLRVELLGEDGKPRAASVPLSVDNTLQRVAWQDAPDLAPFTGKPVRFRFHLRHARLYAFWVSADETGASKGFVAAGGPGFHGPADTVGSDLYRFCCTPRIW